MSDDDGREELRATRDFGPETPAGERQAADLGAVHHGALVAPADDARAAPRPDNVLTLVEERASIAKRTVQTGTVRVSTRTETVEHVETAELGVETIEVERRPVNAWVDSIPPLREEGDLTVLPVVEERLVVEKRLFVTEEIHIRRVRSTETVELPVSLRRQHAVVERLAPEGNAGESLADPSSTVNQ